MVKNIKPVKSFFSVPLRLCVSVFKKRAQFFAFTLIAIFYTLTSIALPYTQSPHVPPDIWQKVEPYFLPENHPIKTKLDEIFSKSRALQDHPSLKKAGFKFKKRAKWDQIIVARHAKLKGWRIKLFTDNQINVPDWPMWVRRIEGAHFIQSLIDKHHYNHLFKTPQKWIYPLPSEPSPGPNTERKNFIMIVADMNLIDLNLITGLWDTEDYMTDERIKALYTLLQEGGLLDSVYIDNVPISNDGLMAFIDTEHYCKWPVEFSRLTWFFPTSKQALWEQLIQGR